MGFGCDIVLINPGERRRIYQALGENLCGIEPPYWLAVQAAFLRMRGARVEVLDINAEGLDAGEAAARATALRPRLIAVTVYGAQPSASTQTMGAAGRFCRAVKTTTAAPVVMNGLHPSALPEQTLREEAVDFVAEGEGMRTLAALLDELRDGTRHWQRVPGLWYWNNGQVAHTARASLLESADWPRAAWDLLPMQRYRAHNWHCFDDLSRRSPYAALYTSLGCPFCCEFCCIHVPFGGPGVRFRHPEAVVDEIAFLAETYGVRNIKLMDELFVLKPSHYMSIARGLCARRLELNIWAYARVDTLQPAQLEELRRAGVRWLALGIESASPAVRNAVHKSIHHDIHTVAAALRDAGVWLMANYLFGLPEDTRESMEATLQLALDLRAEFANFYCAMAYPGSALYSRARAEGWALPASWEAYSQHAYETLPLPTKHVDARTVLAFRDAAFHRYCEDAAYLAHVQHTFGAAARQHVEELTRTRLRRKLLEIDP